jgi:hypothetical protein
MMFIVVSCIILIELFKLKRLDGRIYDTPEEVKNA